MPFYQRGDTALYYEYHRDEAPVAATVTLINGHTRSSSDFKLWGRRLAALGFAVLACDNRGAGQTTTPSDFSLSDMVGDVHALWQELGIKRSALVGISMGGFIAAQLAALYPAVVSHLVLISSAADNSYLEANQADDGWPADEKAISKKLQRYVAPAFYARNRLLLEAMAKTIYKAVVAGAFAGGAAAQRRALAGLSREAMQATVAAITAPSLVVHGGEDAIIPVAAAYDLQARLAAARLQVWPDAGHLLLAEKPNELYELVATFIGALPSEEGEKKPPSGGRS